MSPLYLCWMKRQIKKVIDNKFYLKKIIYGSLVTIKWIFYISFASVIIGGCFATIYYSEKEKEEAYSNSENTVKYFEKLVKAFPELALDDNADIDESMVKEADTLEDEVREVLAETPSVEYELFDHNDYVEIQFITKHPERAIGNLEKHFKVTPATHDADDCYHISRK